MNEKIFDVIVIGGGHAGLAASYYLRQKQIFHVVLERGHIGESWRTQRWNSFVLNSSNKFNILPGDSNVFDNEDAFCSAHEFVKSLESYVRKFQLPVIENCDVGSVEKKEDSGFFVITAQENGRASEYACKQVIIASGGQNSIQIPAFSKNISPDILQLHAAAYRNPQSLMPGAVLVIGSAQSGTQIAEDLVANGKKVYLSTGRVGRIPRRYRRRDMFDWLIYSGYYDIKTEAVTDPDLFKIKSPQVSGVGERGRTTSLQSLAKDGAVILGKAYDANASTVFLQNNAAEHIHFGDEFSAGAKAFVDAYITKMQLEDLQHEIDEADLPDTNASCAATITELNLAEHNITSIIWATGFKPELSYIKLPVVNNEGKPIHKNGISVIDGLFFLGFPWLRTKKSAIICGIHEDVEFIVNTVASRFAPVAVER